MDALSAESPPVAAAPALPWRWRVASWLATAAAVLVLGFAIAHWGWRWWTPPMPVPSASPVVGERWASVIVAVPLFGRADAPAAAGPSPAAVSPTDLRLLGVFAEMGGAGYALFRLGEHGPILVRAGADFATQVTLVEVRPDGVTIRDRGEIRVLDLRARAVSGPAPRAPVASATACVLPRGYKGPVYRLNAELLTGIASRPESWRALLVPAAGGLAVREGNGLAAMLGMKAGDQMTQANGIALARIDDVLVAFVNPLLASQPVHVVGTRNGKQADWLFVNAGVCPG